ncbi:MAG: ribonuclease D [Verrucomicrobiales bacterium]
MEAPAPSSASPPPVPPSAIIETTEALVAYLDALPPAASGRHRCAVDTEADSLHSYREKLCLIQFTCAERHIIIDPLRVGDLSPLLGFLRDAEVWMHGADFDMSLFKRTFDFVPPTVLDTQTAARLVGFRQFGLAHLLQDVFNVTLSKQSQRADWGRRPLPPVMVEYALNDVRYILPLADRLLGQLEEVSRLDWFHQSCAAAREQVLKRTPPDGEEAWRITGWGNLQPRGLAALRALWHWRNGEAERLDRPAFKVLNNEPLLQMAMAFQNGQEPQLPPRFPPPARRRFHQALAAAGKLPPDQWPKRLSRKRTTRHPEAEKRFDQLKGHRDRVASTMNLDGSLIASRSILEELAQDIEAHAQLLPWQRDLLMPAVESLRGREPSS